MKASRSTLTKRDQTNGSHHKKMNGFRFKLIIDSFIRWLLWSFHKNKTEYTAEKLKHVLQSSSS